MMKKQMDAKQSVPALELIPYPSHPFLKYAFKFPIFLWRLGFGFIVGRLFMITTTTGQKSGAPRRTTAIEYHVFRGRKYVLAAWPKSDWYLNFLADPHLTIQTASGTERVIARGLADNKELAEAFEFVEQNPMMRKVWQVLGLRLNREEFIAQKERFRLITFDPTEEQTPPALETDLGWMWLVVLAIGLIVWLTSLS